MAAISLPGTFAVLPSALPSSVLLLLLLDPCGFGLGLRPLLLLLLLRDLLQQTIDLGHNHELLARLACNNELPARVRLDSGLAGYTRDRGGVVVDDGYLLEEGGVRGG